MAELHTFRPLFPGSSESDQLYKICSVCGTPSPAQWPEGQKLAAKIGFRFPQFVPTKLEVLIPTAGPESIDLMNMQLFWDPSKRVSAAKALQHPYFEASQVGMQPEESALPRLASEAGDPSGAEGKLPRVPLPAQKDFPAHFLMNNLNGTQGSKGGNKREGSQPSTGRGSDGAQKSELPALRQPPSQKGAEGRGMSSRYLRMARYQPGMMQTPVPTGGASEINSKMMNGSTKLPAMGPTPTGTSMRNARGF